MTVVHHTNVRFTGKKIFNEAFFFHLHQLVLTGVLVEVHPTQQQVAPALKVLLRALLEPEAQALV